MSLNPTALVPGSTIGIVCVDAPEPAQLPDQFDKGIAALESLGYTVTVAAHTRGRDGFHAAPAEAVAADLHALFADPSVGAILCAGGGITANRLLPLLDFALIEANPTIFMGASNPTVLLNAITAHTGLITFHGPSVMWDFGDADQPQVSVDSFHAAVRGEAPPCAPLTAWLRPGTATGTLVGGNLGSLMQLIGTPHEPDFTGAVLAWEEIGTDAAHIAAHLLQLDQHGVLDKIAGMVVGELVDCGPSYGVAVSEAVLNVCGDRFPIATGLPFGHTALKYTLPIGATVTIDIDAATLVATDAVVATQAAVGS
ncbi:S66 peptidase family protein [Nocardia neocaledoniensis]|uniref:S66 peptidase family protein n=1 Tax=Nocardia neocaledoniensis TaxID=236511 RepID=UPI0024566027|nr:LD-carboxypeptidase [Nocardia neocaledoniensis]